MMSMECSKRSNSPIFYYIQTTEVHFCKEFKVKNQLACVQSKTTKMEKSFV